MTAQDDPHAAARVGDDFLQNRRRILIRVVANHAR